MTSLQLAEHFRSYQNTWERNANIQATLLATETQCLEINAILMRKSHRQSSKPVPQYNCQPIDVSRSTIAQPLPAPIVPAEVNPVPIGGPSSSAWGPLRPPQSTPKLGTKGPEAKTRKGRHCRRCGRLYGKGKGNCEGAHSLAKCFNPCQDCGARDCPGCDPKNFNNNKTCDRDGNRPVKATKQM